MENIRLQNGFPKKFEKIITFQDDGSQGDNLQKKKNNVICKVRNTYSGSDIEVSIFIKGVKNANQMNTASEVPAVNHVSALKKADVQKLLGGFVLTEEASVFYDEVMGGGVINDDNTRNSFEDTEVDC